VKQAISNQQSAVSNQQSAVGIQQSASNSEINSPAHAGDHPMLFADC
jgi:hypothetical protein